MLIGWLAGLGKQEDNREEKRIVLNSLFFMIKVVAC